MASYNTIRRWPCSSVPQTPLYLETPLLTSMPSNFSSPKFNGIPWENPPLLNTPKIVSSDISYQSSSTEWLPTTGLYSEAEDFDLLAQKNKTAGLEYSPACSSNSSDAGWTQNLTNDVNYFVQYPRYDGCAKFHNLNEGHALARPELMFPTENIMTNLVDCWMTPRNVNQHAVKPKVAMTGKNYELLHQRAKSNKIVKLIPSNTVYLPRPAKECDFEGCGRKFGREEHLKRHKKIHLKTEIFTCPFCGKSCSRFDNLQAHIKRHDKGDPNRPNRRTKYFKEAAPIIKQMSKKRLKDPFRNK